MTKQPLKILKQRKKDIEGKQGNCKLFQKIRAL